MTAPAKPLRARLLAAVHAKLKAKSMPDDVYRDFLWDNFETASAAALTDAGLRELLHRLDHWRRERAFYRDSRYIWVLWPISVLPAYDPNADIISFTGLIYSTPFALSKISFMIVSSSPFISLPCISL